MFGLVNCTEGCDDPEVNADVVDDDVGDVTVADAVVVVVPSSH